MKTLKLIASTSILSCILALSIIACGPINDETADRAVTESTTEITAETATSTTTALTSSLTAVSTRVSTVTTPVTTTALTACTDVSTAISTNAVETETEKHEDNTQDNVQDVPVEQIEIKVEDNHYNDNKAAETAEPVIAEPTPEPIVTEEYVVYKPSSHYAHRSTCRWNSGDAYRCDNFADLEVRLCTECNPEIGEQLEYVEPEPEPVEVPTADKDSMTYVKHFTRGTYYAYGGERYGGSGRYLYDCSCGNGNDIKGSIASSYLYNNYGYNYNGERTKVYLEVVGYPNMSGYYYCDDSDAGNWNVIDFFYWYESNCQFQYQGVVEVDVWI